MSKPKNINCPNCGEPWSVLEVQEQECFECGYPNHDSDTDAVEYSAGLVHEIPHSGRGLTTSVRIDLPNSGNSLHSKNRHHSELQHSSSNIQYSK